VFIIIIFKIIIIIIIRPGKNTWWLKNYQSKLPNLSGSEPYSGRSSSI